MQLVLDTNGLMVKKKNDAFWIISKTEKRLISPKRITSIAVTADCLLSSAAIKLAAKHQIPIYFFDYAARLQARLWSPQFGSIATIRRRQLLFATQPAATLWVIQLFQLKAQHQIACLNAMRRRKPGKSPEILQAIAELEKRVKAFDDFKGQLLDSCRNNIMGQEGIIAKAYWRLISPLLPQEFQFQKRSRRPAGDAFNASLNYLYGMLYSVISSAILAAGMDPFLGFLHADEYNKPTFTFDMIEPFRPWIDQLLIMECLHKNVKQAYFDQKEGAYMLNQAGKRYIIPLFNDFMEERIRFRNRDLSRKNHIYRFAGEFAQTLIAAENEQT